MSPIVGIAIVVDDEFRKIEHCSQCGLAIGDKPFLIDVKLSPPYGVKYEHIECRQAAAQLGLVDLPPAPKG